MLKWTEKLKLNNIRRKIIYLENRKELVKEYNNNINTKLKNYRKEAKKLIELDYSRDIPPKE